MKTTTPTRATKAQQVSRDLSIHTILVPTDFSPPSLKALQYARALAKEFHATLHLINVFDVQFEAPSLAPLYATDDKIERRLGRRLRAIAGEFAVPIRKGHCHARIGRACDEICEVAGQFGIDLIVTGTRGYTGLKHVLIGSTAERVVRHAPCPVLVVREKEREFVRAKNGKPSGKSAALRLRRILVPTDFSENSRVALQYAIGFARRFNSKLTLMNVIHPQYYAINPDVAAIDYGMLLDSIRSNVRRDMNHLVRSTAFQGVPFKTHIDEGHPGNLIAKYAKKCGAELIVNATHGRSGLGHVLLGSTAGYVVRYASTPVLVVPRTSQAHRTQALKK